MVKGIIIGALGLAAAGLLCACCVISFGLIPANADSPPPSIEKLIARKSLGATLRREAPKGPSPVPLNDENLLAGIRLYAANCAVCHGGADGSASNVARGLYQKPPQFAKHDVTDDPEGRTYWVVAHGIRMTGMPAFKPTLSEEQLWQVTLFLAHQDKLSPAAKEAWEAVPSQGPGGAAAEPEGHEHHHKH